MYESNDISLLTLNGLYPSTFHFKALNQEIKDHAYLHPPGNITQFGL